MKDQAPVKAAMTAQIATAVAIVTAAPVRASNLAAIRLGENLVKPGGPDTPYLLVFPDPDLTRARMFRNGLMVALLAYCPIRLKNFAALEIGRSFVNVDGTWWIVLTAAETKEKREDERPVPDDLTRSIERYLQIYRPVLARGTAETDPLWLAMDGSR